MFGIPKSFEERIRAFDEDLDIEELGPTPDIIIDPDSSRIPENNSQNNSESRSDPNEHTKSIDSNDQDSGNNNNFNDSNSDNHRNYSNESASHTGNRNNRNNSPSDNLDTKSVEAFTQSIYNEKIKKFIDYISSAKFSIKIPHNADAKILKEHLSRLANYYAFLARTKELLKGKAELYRKIFTKAQKQALMEIESESDKKKLSLETKKAHASERTVRVKFYDSGRTYESDVLVGAAEFNCLIADTQLDILRTQMDAVDKLINICQSALKAQIVHEKNSI